ncbi:MULTISPECIES: DUF881 domain-containing protein [unclassified Fusibacter]|uniref:DUF881 domain-containing protein n=1 Tax=unclassified Fusibacter TaxID=2624464 RepID=UPI0010135535|nr:MULTISPECIES: DUF881 domain-containing protein [unclassified Fusibacter]MCK8061315.1 DUF881 domain-containing protein [Fusibacter sp. A2]NPE23488.1 DUF881 domain-containing protein [Fusibacter sp. A1]RXV59094.1 DUF881 domain-containing protein [Fusibacter sp. A1]
MKIRDQIIIGIICVILGVFAAIQFKTVQDNYLEGLIPSQRSTQLVNELTKLRADKTMLSEELSNLETQLNDITESVASDNALVKGMQDQLERYKMIAGFTDIQGQGVIVTVDNPVPGSASSLDSDIVSEFHYILMLANELNAAGAEAISINEQRLISTSEIRSAGDAISINRTQCYPPFVIKAIGNRDVLENALNPRFGMITILRSRDFQVEITRFDTINIPKYNDIINWQYARPKEQ